MLTIVDRLMSIPPAADIAAYTELGEFFETAAVSDIAWRRTCPGARAFSRTGPTSRPVAGPPAEPASPGSCARAGIDVEREPADHIPYGEELEPSDLLSEELDVFGRDAVYEDAAATAGRL
jgi:hypothetical protein